MQLQQTQIKKSPAPGNRLCAPPNLDFFSTKSKNYSFILNPLQDSVMSGTLVLLKIAGGPMKVVGYLEKQYRSLFSEGLRSSVYFFGGVPTIHDSGH